MSTKDWYARRLAAEEQPPTNEPPPMFTPPVLQSRPAGYRFQSVASDTATRQAEEDVAEMTKSATVLRQQGACPECGGTNYLKPSPSSAQRCFDCGYPVKQSGSGAPSMTGVPGVPVHKAIQPDTQGTWQGGNFQSGAGLIGRDPAVKSEAPR